jgi:hypothetical protein
VFWYHLTFITFGEICLVYAYMVKSSGCVMILLYFDEFSFCIM